MKIKREKFQTFINCTPTEDTATYEVLGEDLEELSVEMGANVTKKSNILGKSTVNIGSYDKSASVTPYIADKGSALFTYLKKIIDDELLLDDLKTDIVNVDVFGETSGSSYPAIREDVVIEVTSHGGNTDGYQIPFKIHFCGNRTKGTFDPTTKKFTASA